jgi:hypothetical protein
MRQATKIKGLPKHRVNQRFPSSVFMAKSGKNKNCYFSAFQVAQNLPVVE